MNEPFSFGAPERRRFAMQFGYDMRPSFWQGVRTNSHLVIAAIGTAALLGVAGIALWLALPANDRQASASIQPLSQQSVPTIPVKTTKIAPVTPAATVAAAAPQAARKGDAVSPAVAAGAAAIPALAANDPRWTAPQSNSDAEATPPDQATTEQAAAKPADAAAYEEPSAQSDATTQLSKVAAPDAAAKDGHTDGAETAAIPTPKPQLPDAESPAATDDTQASTKPQKVAAAAGTGRILRTVTMRTGPQKNAAAMGTVPAKSSVQVVSCKKWCQIVYNGKRGWIYKSYIKTGA
ncbi:SH3 domain-containing protein [Mesorhizobium neociceri]|uniref:SH3 domain-containing protein n=1 Tax=Mesorhizobium neociceri TaxID=1307853 RepID=A0A838B490_9HYPH|nr:SH3 domain-containing protein [Mesorhizobium neociceri]MBA1141668.1 SH3 domain-containing protein [Mesorhizobium neociceri]